MEGKKAALVGAAAAMAVLPATSYAELLQPIPNASEHLKALEAIDTGAGAPQLTETQYVVPNQHHHHHHHHHHYRRGYVWRNSRWWRVGHHHHHHHHHS